MCSPGWGSHKVTGAICVFVTANVLLKYFFEVLVDRLRPLYPFVVSLVSQGHTLMEINHGQSNTRTHKSTAHRAAPTDLLSALSQRRSSRQGQSSSTVRSETDTGTRWCPAERPPQWRWWHLGGSGRWRAVGGPGRGSCCRWCLHPKPRLKKKPFGGDQIHWCQQLMSTRYSRNGDSSLKNGNSHHLLTSCYCKPV